MVDSNASNEERTSSDRNYYHYKRARTLTAERATPRYDR
jgi:hypothetical protein